MYAHEHVLDVYCAHTHVNACDYTVLRPRMPSPHHASFLMRHVCDGEGKVQQGGGSTVRALGFVRVQETDDAVVVV